MNFFRKHKGAALFFLFSTLGFYLRFKASLQLSYWLDEVLIFKTTQLPLMDLILMRHWDQAHPQLYYIFMHFWQQLGTTELFLRLPSLLLYFPSVFFVYDIGRSVFNKQYGYLASLLFAVHPFLSDLGFQAKIYSFVIFFILGSFWSLLKTINTNDKKWRVMFIIFSILAFYTDYSTVWYLGSLVISFFLTAATNNFPEQYINKIKTRILDFIIIGVFVSLQIPLFITGLEQALKLENFLPHPRFTHILNTLSRFSGLTELNHVIVGVAWLFIIAMLAIYLTREKTKIKQFFIYCLLSFTIFTISTSYIISQHSQIFVPRNMWIVILTIVFGLPILTNYNLKSQLQKSISYFLGIIVISLYSSAMFYNSNVFSGFDSMINIDWKEVKKEITDASGSKSILIIGEKEWAINPLKDYYLPGYNDGTTTNVQIHKLKVSEVFSLENAKEIDYLGKNLWIFMDHEVLEDLSDQEYQIIQNNLGCDRRNCSEIYGAG